MDRGISLSRVRTRSQTSEKRRYRQNGDLGSTSNTNNNQRITIDDDEDDEDVQILTPPSAPQAKLISLSLSEDADFFVYASAISFFLPIMVDRTISVMNFLVFFIVFF